MDVKGFFFKKYRASIDFVVRMSVHPSIRSVRSLVGWSGAHQSNIHTYLFLAQRIASIIQQDFPQFCPLILLILEWKSLKSDYMD